MQDCFRIFNLKTSFRSVRTTKFMKCLEKLPADVQAQAQEAFKTWKQDPSKVDFKPLEAYQKEVWSAHVGRRYRALAARIQDETGRPAYVWMWIGSHEEYNKLCKGGLNVKNESAPRKKKVA